MTDGHSSVTQVAAGLHSKDWQARTGCAACLGQLAEMTQHHDCASLAAACHDTSTADTSMQAQQRHSLEGFPLSTVLAQGTILLAAEQQVGFTLGQRGTHAVAMVAAVAVAGCMGMAAGSSCLCSCMWSRASLKSS